MAAVGFEWCVDTAMEIVADSKDKTKYIIYEFLYYSHFIFVGFFSVTWRYLGCA